ncbi:hypothetical protein [Flavobacterium rhizosphaerae]|uniref:Uncharacterized protein n=1 Tax=Flavobacterium rhizosphaerae TaxID=3163298 RepID=A0ABW8YZZ3_9FLAO
MRANNTTTAGNAIPTHLKQQPPHPNLKTRPIQRKLQLEELPEGIPIAYLPAITNECHALSMQAYRRHISVYNRKVRVANDKTEKHNFTVEQHLAKAQDLELIGKFQEMFHHRNASKGVWEFNAAVDEACAQYGPILTKARIQTVKAATEQFFSTFLYEYSVQLNRRNTVHLKYTPVRQPEPIPPLDLNSYRITQIKREEGIYSLPVHKKTVANHRQRLHEAGVFVNYTFRGSFRGIHVHINPEILAFFDIETQKLTRTEIQPLTGVSGKKLPECSCGTGATIRPEKSKNAVGAFVDKVPAKPAPSTGQEQDRSTVLGTSKENSPGGAARKVLNVPENPESKALKSLILNDNEFCERLARGRYDNYAPLDPAQLEREVKSGNGTMTNQEFVNLVLQCILSFSAHKLYPGRRNISIGCWINTLSHMRNQFILKHGSFQNKANMLSWYYEYMDAIAHAARWVASQKPQKTKKLFIPWPSIYFNHNSKPGMGVNIRGAIKLSQDSKKRSGIEPKMKQAARKMAEKIVHKRTSEEKFKAVMDDFMAGRKTTDQLLQYVQRNIPDYLDKVRDEYARRLQNAAGVKTYYA